jgi:glycosyltransferase involved in cell wall biosynthesis
MKVLMVNATDIFGGAARAAFRLHQGLRSKGVDSRMLVEIMKGNDPFVIGPQNDFQKVLAYARPRIRKVPVLLYFKRSGDRFTPAWLPDRLAGRINNINPDIVHLQWIDDFLRIENIPKLIKPIIWTLHDMWAFTGGCHYDHGCGRYQESCGCCPQLGSKRGHDLSYKVLRRKKKSWRNTNMVIVCVSNWLADCARRSIVLGKYQVKVIPNGLDTKRFQPVDKRTARQLLNLPQKKKIILFGALYATSDPRKGHNHLKSAIRRLVAWGYSESIELVIFGASAPSKDDEWRDIGFTVHYLGVLQDDISLAVVYSAADVMVVPSEQEAFGQTATESLSCGVPVVAFAIGGLLDIVGHEREGYLARPFDSEELARGIEWVLENQQRLYALSENSRKKAMDEFDIQRTSSKYVELYQEITEQYKHK